MQLMAMVGQAFSKLGCPLWASFYHIPTLHRKWCGGEGQHKKGRVKLCTNVV